MKKRSILFLAFGIPLTVLGAVVLLQACGTSDTNPTDATGNTAGLTSAASTGGALQGSDTNIASYVPVLKAPRYKLSPMDWLIPSADAALCTPAAVFSGCSGGTVTATFDGCSGPFNVVKYYSNFSLTVFNSAGAAACPAGASGFWTDFLKSGTATLWKQFGSGAYDEDTLNGVTVTFNNTNPTGWDSGVTLTPASSTTPTYSGYGVYRAVTAWNAGGGLSTQTLFNYGIEYTATGVSKKGATVKLWDHTLTHSGTGLQVLNTFSSGVDTKVVSTNSGSEVIIQHNLAKWTGKSTLDNLTFMQGGTTPCGCFPTAGTINTTYTGSRTGYEQVVFDAGSGNANCGAYSITQMTDNTFTTAVSGQTPLTGTLHHCL